MRVIEAEAKAILARRGLAVPSPSLIYREKDTPMAWDQPVAIKAQTLSGKRADAGLVQLAQGDEVPRVVQDIRAKMQAGGSRPVVLVEAQAQISAEYYLAWRIDDVSRHYVLMVSSAGGSDIEERGDTVCQHAHSPLTELHPYHLVPALRDAGIPADHIGGCARFAVALLQVLKDEDAKLLEINPLVVTAKGAVIAVDAKLVFDDNATKRHLERQDLISASLQVGEQTELEALAAEAGLTFVELDGPVAVYSAGAGLGMCLLDMLADARIPAANFADASGGGSADLFADMGEVVFKLAERPEVKAIVVFFVLAATSLKSVTDGILRLIERGKPPKPLVIGLIAAGAAEREITLAEAQRLIEAEGYPCVSDLGDAVAATRRIIVEAGEQ